MSDDLLFTRSGAIGRITFNRPHARNALTFAMYDRLAAICAEVTADCTFRVLVLTGAGDKAFAAGTDPSEYNSVPSALDAQSYVDKLEAALDALERCPVPTIAAISGACTGDGAILAACCDLRIGDPSVRFGLPAARTLGHCLSRQNVARLADLLGAPRVKDLVFTGRLIEAAEAERIGALNEIVPSGSLAARADEIAALLIEHAPQTMTAAKQALRDRREAIHATPDETATAGYLTDTFREGRSAYNDKRKPQWTR
jgi:enoyl-CoA hydratase